MDTEPNLNLTTIRSRLAGGLYTVNVEMFAQYIFLCISHVHMTLEVREYDVSGNVNVTQHTENDAPCGNS